MNRLTPRPQLANNRHTAAKSAVGTRNPAMYGRTGAPKRLFLCRDFVTSAKTVLNGDCAGLKSAQAGGRSVSRTPILRTLYSSHPYSIRNENGGLGNTQYENIAMNALSSFPPVTPEDCYTIAPATLAGKSFPLDAIITNANRSLGVVRMMSLAASDQGEFEQMHRDICNCLWQLEANLQQIPEIISAWLKAQRQGEVNHG